jgi:hypothetical protein
MGYTKSIFVWQESFFSKVLNQISFFFDQANLMAEIVGSALQ